MEIDERTSSIKPAGVMAMACTHRRPDATREAPAVIAVSINWQLARESLRGAIWMPPGASSTREHSDASSRPAATRGSYNSSQNSVSDHRDFIQTVGKTPTMPDGTMQPPDNCDFVADIVSQKNTSASSSLLRPQRSPNGRSYIISES